MSFDIPVTAALKAGQSTAYGFWLTFNSPAVARTILRGAAGAAAATGGARYSWVLLDAEHGLIGDADYYPLATAVAAEGASPLVRVPVAEEWLVKRALDAGAHGVLTPMCHTAADAERIVRWAKYPPVGSRGYGPMFTLHAFPDAAAVTPAAYDAHANRALVVGVQIESRAGVDNVAAIAQVPGLDFLLIGPFDLALQMGVVRGGAEHEAAIQKTLQACKAAGKKAAIFCSNGEQARERAAQGFDLVSVTTDMGALGEAMAQHLGVAHGQPQQGGSKREGY
ncbi:dihydroxyhept-2-ene-1,7-dioic acid aldolase [Niveomyces insectorum RCEF 264]|uniref:Dihydroxyhept-2-ene-1,7-dioic acid aldolase n=1 Tax=Niveomyces insectorum RCEF 264 TaxID=1081102 RepID=A0A167MWU3_9HYPO|nr:dihydroxyhept-2-ene-1,7-dioic acid aldolase [Niveomyces insectorum RCEF 264]